MSQSPETAKTAPTDRPYQWDTLELNVQLRWQPGSLRQVLITATSYDDFPVAVLVNETELGELPPVIQGLLEQLKQDLPVRQLRYQQQAKTKPNASSRITIPPVRTPTPTAPETPATKQIALF